MLNCAEGTGNVAFNSPSPPLRGACTCMRMRTTDDGAIFNERAPHTNPDTVFYTRSGARFISSFTYCTCAMHSWCFTQAEWSNHTEQQPGGYGRISYIVHQYQGLTIQ